MTWRRSVTSLFVALTHLETMIAETHKSRGYSTVDLDPFSGFSAR